tara:strand:- start:246 stop:1139 length:894 start_codon:yes stop_codon:yes gene_type:complete
MLTAYSIDPDMNGEELEKIVSGHRLSVKGKSPIDLNQAANRVRFVREVGRFEDLQIQASFDKYEVPEQLKPYRDRVVLGFSDSVLIPINGDLDIPIKAVKGEYRDFRSTQMSRIPSEEVPDTYEDGKTIEELLPEWGLSYRDLGRCFGVAHVLRVSGGDAISMVYSGDVDVYANSIGLSGSTPGFPEKFNQEEFSYDEFFKEHLDGEMREEFNLSPNNYRVNGVKLFDAIEDKPIFCVDMVTDLSIEELVRGAYGMPDPLKEHSIILSTDRKGMASVMRGFDIPEIDSVILSFFREL